MEKLKSLVESVLFVSGDPVEISRLAKITETSEAEIENVLMALSAEYAAAKRGFFIVHKENEAQMASAPENGIVVEKLLKSELRESLSNVSLETLSIIAYRGPITRPEIDSIRGVNSSFTLRALLMRGLVERVDNPRDSRGYLYKISFDFLKKLGLDRVEKLPDYEELRGDERINSIIQHKEETI